jgi:two-component system chemotaxis response regulator CheY
MKVLIVDDNARVRLLLRDHLPSTVEEVHECDDGIDALASYRRHRPDWVLMDWEMPGMDGIQAIRDIVAVFPAARICMVTAFGDDELREEALAAGARGVVVKSRLFELEAILASGQERE